MRNHKIIPLDPCCHVAKPSQQSWEQETRICTANHRNSWPEIRAMAGKRRVAVIGGGAAGVSTAWSLARSSKESETKNEHMNKPLFVWLSSFFVLLLRGLLWDSLKPKVSKYPNTIQGICTPNHYKDP